MKRKVRTELERKQLVNNISNGKIIVKEFVKSNKCDILYCNDCKSDFKVKTCDFIKHYEKTGKIRHTCDSTGMTFERFLLKVKNQSDLKDNEYSFIGEYIDYSTKILCRHNICGHEWKVLPRHLQELWQLDVLIVIVNLDMRY